MNKIIEQALQDRSARPADAIRNKALEEKSFEPWT